MSRIRFTRFHDGKAFVVGSLSEALEPRGAGGILWVDAEDPTPAELGAIAGPLGIDPLTVEDCLDDNQVPKMEAFPAYLFLLVNTYRYAETGLTTGEVDFLLGRDFLVTVRCLRGVHREFYADLDRRIDRATAEACRGPDRLLHLLLDFVVDRKFDELDRILERVDEAEEAAIDRPQTFRPRDVIRLRRDLLALHRGLFHEREILLKICRRDSSLIDDSSLYSFRDIYDHLSRFFESIEICRERITSLMELHVSMQNNRLAQASNQIGLVMKRLTVITTIFMPLTFLAGVGGMSEWTMMTGGEENWPWAYGLLSAGMAVVGIANYLWLKRVKWF
jgi:magnesium transporter